MSSGPGVYPSSTATTDYDAAIEKARKAQEKTEAMRQAQINNFKPAKDLSELEAQLSQSKWNNLFSMDEKAMGSGSNTTDSQFVCYRAITGELQLPYEFDADMEEFGITNEIWEIAGTLVNNSLELECYIEMLRKGTRAGDIDPSHKLYPGSWLTFGEKIVTPHDPQLPITEEIYQSARWLLSNHFSKPSTTFVSGDQEGSPPEKIQMVGEHSYTAYKLLSAPPGNASVAPQEAIPHQHKQKRTLPEAEDENIVNCFIIILLDQAGFVMKLSRKGVLEWSMKRAQVEAQVDDKSFKAQTDGALRSKYGKTLQAAIEVKKAVRECNDNATTKQEVSQIVGMIKEGYPAVFNGQYV